MNVYVDNIQMLNVLFFQFIINVKILPQTFEILFRNFLSHQKGKLVIITLFLNVFILYIRYKKYHTTRCLQFS